MCGERENYSQLLKKLFSAYMDMMNMILNDKSAEKFKNILLSDKTFS